ncbi:MAG: hypothetical protein JW703_02485 [Candidatus Diapherotrites archaeon]|nr:hypothetical protein [Candidatus Diapherotrites archaeon]
MNDEIKISKKKLIFIAGILIALILGFVLGNFFPLNSNTNLAENNAIDSVNSIQYSGLIDSDKNFLVSLTNSEIDVILNKSDWCVDAGGQWKIDSQEGELEVTSSEAMSLKKQNRIVEEREGKFYAKVTVINRETCILFNKN